MLFVTAVALPGSKWNNAKYLMAFMLVCSYFKYVINHGEFH